MKHLCQAAVAAKGGDSLTQAGAGIWGHRKRVSGESSGGQDSATLSLLSWACDELEGTDEALGRTVTQVPWAPAGLLVDRSAATPPLRNIRTGNRQGHPPPEPTLNLKPGAADIVEVTIRGDTVRPQQLGAGMVPTSAPPPQITADLLSNGIDVYPQKEFDEDAEDRLVNEKFRVSGLAGCSCGWVPQFLLGV